MGAERFLRCLRPLPTAHPARTDTAGGNITPASPSVTSRSYGMLQVAGCAGGVEVSGVLCLCLPAVVQRLDPHGTRIRSKAERAAGLQWSL